MSGPKPHISLRNGYFMINTGGDAKLTNYLEEAGAFTGHYSNPMVYYCMANKWGCEAFKKYIFKYKERFAISPAVVETLINNGIDYVTEFYVDKIKTIPNITLFPHQTEAVEKMLTHSGYCFFLGQGSGKTLIALSFLYNINTPGLYVVVTPKRVIDQYYNEAEKHLGRTWKRIKDLKDYDPTRKNLFIINYESVAKLKGHNIHTLILDESHRAKSYSSETNKILRSLDKGCCYLFTGTPQDKIQSEILYQMAIINNNYVGGKTLFLNRYFILDDYFNPKRCTRPSEINGMIESISMGKEADQLVKLTDKHIHQVKCGKTTDEYRQMLRSKVLKKDGIAIIADSDSKMRMKLRQLASGFCLSECGEIIHTDKPKLDELKKLTAKLDRAIIYTNFDQEIADITTVLTEGKDCEVVSGKTKDNDSKIQRFKDGEYPFLVINAKSGNAGLDLVITNNIIFYSLPESFIVFDQCQSRIRRIGQDKPCNYYYLLVPGSIDMDILRALTKKQSFSSKLFKIYIKESGNE